MGTFCFPQQQKLNISGIFEVVVSSNDTDGKKGEFDKHYLSIISNHTAVNRFSDSTEVENLNEAMEPILTEETLPNEVGEWDLRFNFDYSKNDEEINITLPQVQLFFGILENFGGEISLPLEYRKGDMVEYGLGSISTSVKWLIIHQSYTVPAIVLGLEAEFPTNSFNNNEEESAYELSPYIASLKNFGELSVQGNLGRATEFPVSGEENNHTTKFNIALSYPIFEGKAGVIAELNSSWSTLEENTSIISPGIKYNFSDEHFLALAAPQRINSESTELRFIFQYQSQL